MGDGSILNTLYYTWPLARLTVTDSHLKLVVVFGIEYVLRRECIQQLSRYPHLFALGVRIHHNDPELPPFILFWTFRWNYRALRKRLQELEYPAIKSRRDIKS